jgi:hypothetical protein
LKTSKKKELALFALTIGAILLYLFIFEFHFYESPYICAVCRGRIFKSTFYLSDFKFLEIKSKIADIDETYQRYINENHSHIWVSNGFTEATTPLALKNKKVRRRFKAIDLIEPTSVYIFTTSLKNVKEALKKGNSKNLLKQYHEDIEKMKSNNNLEDELNAKYKSLSEFFEENM